MMMKKLNFCLRAITFALFILVIAGCDRFKLLNDADSVGNAAGINLKSQTIKDYLLADHSSDLTALDLFASAVSRAGLMDTLGKSKDYTVVFLSNSAVQQLLATIGYSSVNDAPPVILRNILGDLIFRGKLKSTDLALNETRKMQTINGNYIFYTRTASSSDQYLLTINKDATLSSSSAVIRSQNLEFNNGVAQVTGQFTFYRLLDDASDAAVPGGNVSTQNLIVAKDVYIRAGTGNATANFNDPATIDLKAISAADATVGRVGVLQFPLTQPTFGNKIGAARMFLYVYNTGLTSSTIFSFSAYLGENKNWDENAITWNNSPTYNSVPISTISVPGAYVGWVSFDVTAAVSQLYGNQGTFVNIFVKHNIDNFIKLRPREFSAGLYSAYIQLTSPPATILQLGHVAALRVPIATQSAFLTLANLQMTGTADKNITYTVKQVPTAGYLVKYGIPLSANASFSQSDIAKGAIKYLYSGPGSTDKIIFEARDNNGGYFPTELTVNVNIN